MAGLELIIPQAHNTRACNLVIYLVFKSKFSPASKRVWCDDVIRALCSRHASTHDTTHLRDMHIHRDFIKTCYTEFLKFNVTQLKENIKL